MTARSGTGAITSVNIRPEVTILSVLQHLNYQPWFALAEFVDNALQSFLINGDAIKIASGPDTVLQVDIELDLDGPGRMVIRDNAAGIARDQFPRAFRPAEVPTDRSGLSEFGMGMKSAACWFARKWSVRTKALGEDVEHTVSFDIDEIVSRRLETMAVTARSAPTSHHYTEVVLEELHHPPKGRTVTKIREHLASIYRTFLRDGLLQLRFRKESLQYLDPPILSAAPYKNLQAEKVVWRKIIDFDFGQGQHVKGFAALRETASTPYAGFALFRRNRLIVGSGDETYRPSKIFGNSNSYRYQRLFGELHLEGFEVSHTKDGFRWEEFEDIFLDLLREELERPPLDLLSQAEGHRTRASKGSVATRAQAATDSVAEIVQTELPPIIERAAASSDPLPPLPPELPPSDNLVSERTVELSCAGQDWEILVRTTVDPSVGDWLSIGERYVRTQEKGHKVRCLTIEVSWVHPFAARFLGANNENVELLLRSATAFALSLVLTEDATSVSPSFALHYVNTLLRDALSEA
jgi:hypothetical protein